MKYAAALYDYLHNTCEASTYEIGELLGVLPNTVICNLRYHGKLRKAQGRDIEEQVAKFFEDKHGYKVERQRGDARFDLLVNNMVRVEVKSSHLCKNGRYVFDLQHHKSSRKNYQNETDIVVFVFLDEPGRPMYTLHASDVPDIGILSVKDPENSKHRLIFYNNLI